MPWAGEAPASFSLAGRRVWVAGHTGMVGSALVRRLARESCELLVVSRDEVDLRRQQDTEEWMAAQRPDVVVVAAAHVGGIVANKTYPADFLYDNAMIGMNIIHAAHAVGVKRLLWLGSSCVYPRAAPQPIREDSLLTGPLEPTNEAYAIAKITGLKLAQAYARQFGDDFFTAMPTNVYGPNDNFDPELSHVIPAMVRRIEDARRQGLASVTILAETAMLADAHATAVTVLGPDAGYEYALRHNLAALLVDRRQDGWRERMTPGLAAMLD